VATREQKGLAEYSRSGQRKREDTTSLHREDVARTLNTAKVMYRDFFSRCISPWRECSTNTALGVRGRDSEVHVNAIRGCFSGGDTG